MALARSVDRRVRSCGLVFEWKVTGGCSSTAYLWVIDLEARRTGGILTRREPRIVFQIGPMALIAISRIRSVDIGPAWDERASKAWRSPRSRSVFARPRLVFPRRVFFLIDTTRQDAAPDKTARKNCCSVRRSLNVNQRGRSRGRRKSRFRKASTIIQLQLRFATKCGRARFFLVTTYTRYTNWNRRAFFSYFFFFFFSSFTKMKRKKKL